MRRWREPENLEIPGLVHAHHPGMTIVPKMLLKQRHRE
jgi:hypothetical protein